MRLCIMRIMRLTIFIILVICKEVYSGKRLQSSYRPMEANFFEHQYNDQGGEDDFDNNGPDIQELAAEYGTEDPETHPRLFEGDIAIDPYTYITLRLGINPMKQPKRLWPDGEIPFEISPKYLNKERAAIIHALKTFNALTCVKFVPYDGEDEDYLYISPGEDGPQGCWSFVGRKGGEQIVSLQPPNEKSPHCFSSEGRIMHEIMHAIGIYHEQSRADRDDFIKIYWDNIVPKYRKNFKLLSKKKANYIFDYDYNSVMHYGEYFFSKQKGVKKTIRPLQEDVRIGQRRTISKIDCLKVNHLYGCLQGRQAQMYKSFCNLLGL